MMSLQDQLILNAGGKDMLLREPDSLFKPVKVNHKFGYKLYDKIILVPQFDFGGAFNQGLATVRIGPKWGFINKIGECVIPTIYDEVKPFEQDLATVCIDKKWGVINKTGRIIVPLKYDEVKPFEQDLATVCIDKKWGVINKTGRIIVPLKYDEVKPFEQDLVAVCIDKKWGYIKTTGEIIIPPMYDDIKPFHQDLTLAKQNGMYFFINKSNKICIILKNIYKSVINFSEGYAIALDENNHYRIIDIKGTETILPYTDIRPFKNGLARICLYRKYGYINHKGELVIAAKYEDAGDFNNSGQAHVSFTESISRDKVACTINKKGQILSSYVMSKGIGTTIANNAKIGLRAAYLLLKLFKG